MNNKLENIITKKHLLIVGGTEMERRKMISKLIEKTNFETFRFPRGMKSFEEYIDFVRKEKLYTPWYETKGKHGINQVYDFHFDWIHDNHCLVVIEDIHMMEEPWNLNIISLYINEVENHKKGEKFIHLVISQDEEYDLIEKLSEEIYLSENENRTKRQIVEGSLKVIEL